MEEKIKCSAALPAKRFHLFAGLDDDKGRYLGSYVDAETPRATNAFPFDWAYIMESMSDGSLRELWRARSGALGKFSSLRWIWESVNDAKKGS